MAVAYADLPCIGVSVDAAKAKGPFDAWRHTIGHGGVNSLPLPKRVVYGAGLLRPRRLRTFIQEYFHVYPAHGVYDWSKLDPYMSSLAAMGADVVAAITIKPKPLYPAIDASVWKPNNVAEWQQVIRALVRRYSVERPIVTHWEVGNETDIGESGGCPYLINTADDYFEYYRMTIAPVLEAFPNAKVGGPALANAYADMLPGFLERCRKTGTRLDFISWHLYSNDPREHAARVAYMRKLLADWPKPQPELMVTEVNGTPSAWNAPPHQVAIEEQAFQPARAAKTAAMIFAMMDAKLDWSFYYHVWDQTAYFADFAPFFGDVNIMPHHWNELPHRFGLFGVNEEVRPQYFVYRMLGRMGESEVAATCEQPSLLARATHDAAKTAVLLVNHDPAGAKDAVAVLRFSHLQPGVRQLRVWRIDDEKRWDAEKLELIPTEQREVDTASDFTCQVLVPADSITLVALESAEGNGGHAHA